MPLQSERGSSFPRFFAIAAILTIGAAGWRQYTQAALSRSKAQVKEILPRDDRRGGYVSSDRCLACHPAEYQSWHRSYHRTMTQFASPETMLGDFKEQTFTLDSETYRIDRRDGGYWAEMPDPLWEARKIGLQKRNLAFDQGPPKRVRERIGLITGSHHMQAYWTATEHGNLQSIFPFAWLKDDHRWVPFDSTFLRDPAMPQSPQYWNRNCINCHATAGQPRTEIQNLLPDTAVAELGIACESCHGPAGEHVERNSNPIRRYTLHRGASDATIVNPSKLDAKQSSQVCGQCHGIRWVSDRVGQDAHGFEYRPGKDLRASDPIIQPTALETQPWLREPIKNNPRFLRDRYWPDGMVRVSGRDYNGLIESPCFKRGNLSCLSCHSMHASEPNNQLASQMQSNEACLQCHQEFRGKIESHTHHKTESTGSECYNCHMPHTTYGLLKAIRSHQITNPDIKVTLQTGRPNACNLCHLDKSMQWTADYLHQWYQGPRFEFSEKEKNLSAAVFWSLTGDAGQRALIAWAMGWKPAQQASGQEWIAPFLGQLLNDPYSAVRYIAQRSLRSLNHFESWQYDFIAPAANRAAAPEAVLQQWLQSQNHPAKAKPEVLIRTDGSLDRAALQTLLQMRDDHSMDLQE